MSFRSCIALSAAAVVAAATPAAADLIVRDRDLFESFAIEGVTLAMSPQEALESLLAAGYSAGEITAYADWDETGVNLTRGSYNSPEGESWVTLERRGDLLVLISETFNRISPPRVDPAAEINAVQSHFAITGDEPRCRYNGSTSGACEIADAADGANVDLIFSMSAHATMILRSISRRQHLGFD